MVTIFMYIFRDCGTGEIWTIYGTDLYKVNKRAYKEYCEEWDRKNASYFDDNQPKETFADFCRFYHEHSFGGFYGYDGLDVLRHDITIDLEEN